MARRLLILRGAALALNAREQEVLQRADLTRQARTDDLLVMADGAADLAFPGDKGGVYGEIFSRAGLARAKAISPDAVDRLVTTEARALISDYWGDYVSVLIAPAGRSHVVRSPFGAMAAYRMRLDGLEVVSNDVGLLIDLGWLGPRIDWSFLAHFLSFPFRRARRTGFEGLEEIPPGSCLTWAPGTPAVERSLWSPWDHTTSDRSTARPEVLKEVVVRTVQAWADGRRKLLLELSGGLDSSVLAACLHNVGAEVRCFNMVSPARDGDERAYARAVANRLGLPLEEFELTAEQVDLTLTPSIRRPRPSGHALLAAWDQALSDRADADQIDAFVSGGGGDNVFFKTHTSTPAADALLLGAIGTWTNAVQDLAAMHGCSVWRAGAMSLRRALAPVTQAWRPDLRFLSAPMSQTRIEDHPWLEGSSDALPGKVEHLKLLMSAHNYLDAFPRSSQAPLLTPLLSQPIVELCLAIPSWAWIRDGRDRAVTRKAFRSDLPPQVIDRRTKGNLSGFAGPAFEASRGKLADHLIGGRLDEAGLLDTASLRHALKETGPPRGADYFRILQIADVESWARRWS